MNLIDQLKEMVGKSFLYKSKEVSILNYCDSAGEEGLDVEIYLSDGTTIDCSIYALKEKIQQFTPIEGTITSLVNQRMNKVSTVNQEVLSECRNTVLEMIRELREDPGRISVAKHVFDGIKTLTDLARTEMEYRKFINQP